MSAPACAARLPGPPELLPGLPDAVVDLQTEEGVELVGAEWRYSDAEVTGVDFVDVGPDLGPSGPANRTFDVVPHAEGADFDDSTWKVLNPADTQLRLGTGRVSFNWYRLRITVPERVGDFDPTGATAVFEVVVDDYAEVWVDGQLPLALGQAGGQVVGGFNTPNRVVLGTDVRPGQSFQLAVFGINGPISASPRNYIWLRSATVDFYAADRAVPTRPAALGVVRAGSGLDAVLPAGASLEQVAGGFEFTEGPVWTPDGALLFSSPNTNVIYRWSPTGTVSIFRTKSGYAGTDIGRYHQPGSNGLTFDPQGRLTMCQHGHRRILRVNPHGDTTVLADRYRGRRLNSPNDLVYRSDGTLYFTDPPFGLPGMFDDPAKELDFSGVFRVREGEAVELVTDELAGPNGIGLSPDERSLYVGNWDPERKVVMRYEVADDGRVSSGTVLYDMTGAAGDDAIDGLKVDVAGNLYVCGPGGVWILSANGVHLGTLELPEAPHNLAWGDADARTLYVTAMTSIYRIRLAVPGVRP
ncbi:MAG TPA: SMP-30/gluconolactonase/LRE family protein [Acidimicrobiia bacterium]